MDFDNLDMIPLDAYALVKGMAAYPCSALGIVADLAQTGQKTGQLRRAMTAYHIRRALSEIDPKFQRKLEDFVQDDVAAEAPHPARRVIPPYSDELLAAACALRRDNKVSKDATRHVLEYVKYNMMHGV